MHVVFGNEEKLIGMKNEPVSSNHLITLGKEGCNGIEDLTT